MASLALAFDILARDRASQTFDKVGDSADRTGGKLSGLGSKFGGLAKAAAIGTAGLAAGAVALGKGFVDAAVESQKITAQTAAVIKSMGGVAGVSADQVAKLSEKLSMQTGVDDELIQSGQNVLLTFGNVQNAVGDGPKIFDRATKAALDMSVALGQDMSSASMMVGKALNDPIDGISKLSRSGIQFSDQQKEQIKTMQEAGDMAGAQAVMLAELERQFGGSAEAQATAGDKLKVVWGNLQEQLGEKLLPVVEKVASFLATALPKVMDRLAPVFKEIAGGVRAFAGAFQNADDGITSSGFPGFMERLAITARRVFDQIAAKVREWGPIVVGALQAVASFLTDKVIPTLVKLGQWVAENQPVLIGLGVAIATGLVAAFTSWAVSAGAAAAATIAAAAPVIAIGAAIAALTAGVIYAYQNWDFFRNAVDAVANFITGKLWPAFQTIVGFIRDEVIPVIADVIGAYVRFYTKVAEVAVGVVSKVVEIGTGIANFVTDAKTKFDDIVSFVTGLPRRIKEAAAGMWDGIKDAFKSALNWIIRGWNNLEFKIPGFDPPGPGPSFDGFTLGVPDIKELHTGGSVTANGIEPLRSDEIVAKLQVGETVYPKGTGPASVDKSQHFGQLVLQTTASPRAWLDELAWRGAGL